MSLHDVIKSDATSIFVNANDFGEEVKYIKSNGETRVINAVVAREAFAVLPEDGDSVTPVFEIVVANDLTYGISSSELNLGGDSLLFSVRVGSSPKKRSILRLTSHDEGMLTLECR